MANLVSRPEESEHRAMTKDSLFAAYLAVITAIFSSAGAVLADPVDTAFTTEYSTPSPTPTGTSTPTASPTPTPFSLTASGFKSSLDDSQREDDDDTTPRNNPRSQAPRAGDTGSSNSGGSAGSSLGQQILPMVAGALTPQLLGEALPQMGIPGAGVGSPGGFGNKGAFGQSGQVGPDGFQMPRLCSTGAKNRSQFQQELAQNPALAEKLVKLCVKEVGSQGSAAQVAVYETLFNRAQGEGNSIQRAIHNGYYEPMNKGTVDSVSTGSSAYQECKASLQVALGGSNTVGCRRHNATTPADAEGFGADPNSIVRIGGETFYSKPGEKCDENFC